MRVSELTEALILRFPLQDAEPWDHAGLSVGDPAADVTGVAVALDAAPATMQEAADRRANVLVTHHPVYIKAPDAFMPAGTGAPFASAAVYEAARLDLSVISLHTNLDRSPAARRRLPGLLGLSESGSLEHPGNTERPGLGSICVCEALSLDYLAARCAAAFDTEPRVWGRRTAPVARVGILGGSLGSLGDLAVDAGCDCVVTGEACYHVCQDLVQRGCSVILLGHDRSEEPLVEVLGRSVADAGVPAGDITTIRGRRQWWTLQDRKVSRS